MEMWEVLESTYYSHDSHNEYPRDSIERHLGGGHSFPTERHRVAVNIHGDWIPIYDVLFVVMSVSVMDQSLDSLDSLNSLDSLDWIHWGEDDGNAHWASCRNV